MTFTSLLSRGSIALILASSLTVHAAEPALAEVGKVTVTPIDIQGDALRIPGEVRATTLSNPESVQQLANNLIIRRALAAEAEAAGLANDPAIQSAMRIARERFLSDLVFAKLDDANKPTLQVLEGLAQLNYKANPARFNLPEEYGARHILIKAETPDAKAKATAILAALKAGADFATLAREKSEDGNAKDGGDLGYFPAGQMVPAFDAAVRKMQQPGELSDVVQTQFGYHIIKFEGRRAAGVRPYDTVKVFLMREAEAKYLNEKRLEYVQKIQEKVKFDKAAIGAFAASNSK